MGSVPGGSLTGQIGGYWEPGQPADEFLRLTDMVGCRYGAVMIGLSETYLYDNDR